MAAPLLYLGTTAADLHTMRLEAKGVLEMAGYEVLDGNSFTSAGEPQLVERLREKLGACAGMVQLIGILHGPSGPENTSGSSGVSRARWEHQLAGELGTPCYSFLFSEDFPYHEHAPEAPDKQTAQYKFRKHLQSKPQAWESIETPDRLAARLRLVTYRLEELREATSPASRPPVMGAGSGGSTASAPASLPSDGPQSSSPPSEGSEHTARPHLASSYNRRSFKLWGSLVVVLCLGALGAILMHGFHQSREHDLERKLVAELARECLQQELPLLNSQEEYRALALKEVAGRHQLQEAALENRLSAFGQRVAGSAESTTFEQALAAFATGDISRAHNLATKAATEAGGRTTEESHQASLLSGQTAMLLERPLTAEPHYRQALDAVDRASNPLRWADSASLLAKSLFCLARFPEAVKLQREVLQVQETHLGSDHPDVAKTLLNLAIVESASYRFKEAAELSGKGREMIEKLLGPDHPKMAEALLTQKLISTMESGRDQDSQAWRRAVAIMEKNFGPDHPVVAQYLLRTGGILSLHGKEKDQTQLVHRALSILEKHYGPRHRCMGHHLLYAAHILKSRKHDEEAGQLAKRAEEIILANPESKDLRHALDLQLLAGWTMGLDVYDQRAGEFLLQSVAIMEELYGKNHMQVAIALDTLVLNRRFHPSDENESFARRNVEITERCLGREHPYVAYMLRNLARLLYQAERLDAAVEQLQRAVTILGKSPLEMSAEASDVRLSLAFYLEGNKKHREALQVRSEDLKLYESKHGKDTPGTASRLKDIGDTLLKLGDLGEAESMLRRALSIYERTKDSPDEDRAQVLSKLASVLAASERLNEAEKTMRLSLTLFAAAKKALGHEPMGSYLATSEYEDILRKLNVSNSDVGERVSRLKQGLSVSELPGLLNSIQKPSFESPPALKEGPSENELPGLLNSMQTPSIEQPLAFEYPAVSKQEDKPAKVRDMKDPTTRAIAEAYLMSLSNLQAILFLPDDPLTMPERRACALRVLCESARDSEASLRQMFRDYMEVGSSGPLATSYSRALIAFWNEDYAAAGHNAALAVTESASDRLRRRPAACLQANAMFFSGKNDTARTLYERLLKDSDPKADFGEWHVSSIMDALLPGKTDKERAESNLRKGLETAETIFGPKSIEVALCLRRLAQLYSFKKEHSHERTQLLIRAASIVEYDKVNFLSTPLLARIFVDMGSHRNDMRLVNIQDISRIGESEMDKLIQDGLQLDERIYGKDSPTVADDLVLLSTIHTARSRHHAAEDGLRRALGIFEKHYGRLHTKTIYTRSAHGDALREVGQFAPAEKAILQCLEDYSLLKEATSWGKMPYLLSLSHIYKDSGDALKQEEVLHKAIAIGRAEKSSNNILLYGSLRDLIELLRKNNRAVEAVPFMLQSLEAQPGTIPSLQVFADTTVLADAAIILSEAGRDDEAAPLFERCRNVILQMENNPGDQELKVHILYHYALHFLKKGDAAKAKTLLQRAASLDDKTLDHPIKGKAAAKLSELSGESKRGR